VARGPMDLEVERVFGGRVASVYVSKAELNGLEFLGSFVNLVQKVMCWVGKLVVKGFYRGLVVSTDNSI